MGLEVVDIRAEVERLIQSKTFETSEAHRRLLQYLAEKTISGEADRLKEYTVGLEAFGKSPEYDPRHDSIVRLQVGRLRQKLTTYYQTEANGDAVVVSLPKGAFKLTFEAAPQAPLSETASSAPPNRRQIQVLSAVLIVVALWATIATVVLLRQRRDAATSGGRWTPELETLWSGFLDSKRPLLVCLGTPLFVRLPNLGFFRDPKTNDWPEVEKSDRVNAVRKAAGDPEILPWYAFTGAGEASGAFLVSRLLSTRKPDLLLTRSNLLSWQQIVDNDLVFIGPPKFNLHLQAAALTQDIVIEPNGLRNLRPKPGEPEFLDDRFLPGRQSEGTTHALISRTAGPSGVGEFLVVAGNASADTMAAAEWLTQPWRVKELLAHLRGPSGEMPRYYQAVFKVSFKQGIPVQSSYIFHHVLGPPPVKSAGKQ